MSLRSSDWIGESEAPVSLSCEQSEDTVTSAFPRVTNFVELFGSYNAGRRDPKLRVSSARHCSFDGDLPLRNTYHSCRDAQRIHLKAGLVCTGELSFAARQ